MKGTDAWLLMFMKPFFEPIQQRKMWHVVTNRFITNTYRVPRLCFPSCINRQRASSIENVIFFLYFLGQTEIQLRKQGMLL